MYTIVPSIIKPTIPMNSKMNSVSREKVSPVISARRDSTPIYENVNNPTMSKVSARIFMVELYLGWERVRLRIGS